MLMRRIQYLALFLILMSACDPYDQLWGYSGLHFMKNMTNTALVLNGVPKTWQTQMNVIVQPQDSVWIFKNGFSYALNKQPTFDGILTLDEISVCDLDGNLLCRWRPDNMEREELNVFKEERWRYYRDLYEYDRSGDTYFFWVYDITEEDLQVSID